MGELKNRQQISTPVDKDIYKRFQSLSKQTKIPLSRLFDEAMEESIEKYKARGLYKEDE